MPSDEYIRPISLKLSDELRERLDVLAAERGISRSELIRRYIVAGLGARTSAYLDTSCRDVVREAE